MDYSNRNLLCTEEFFKENFSIDEYLSKCTQKSDLLTLRKDLKDYGSELYKKMVEILKTETEDIINLAENLTNLNSKVDQLSSPMSQLCEEIQKLYISINDAQVCFKNHLNGVEKIRREKDFLNLKIGMIESSNYINNIIASWEKDKDITILERAVNEYSFQFLYSKALGVEGIDEDVSDTATRLLELLDNVFLTGFKLNDEDIILRSLRMYLNLCKQKDAEACIKVNIARPLLSVIFTHKNLDVHNQNVNMLYNQALDVLHKDLKVLFIVLKKNSDMIGFNFVINSFWSEVDKQLCENLPNITAPGNPDLFQKRFKDTWKFLEQIMNLSRDYNPTDKEWTFEKHMKRFNLPVYFEIRFQEIAAKFEGKILTDDWNTCASNGKFLLNVSQALWDGIQSCFRDDVFLVHLADQLLKLKMLLLSRYVKYFEENLARWEELTEELGIQKLEQFVIHSLVDINVFGELIAFTASDLQSFDQSVYKIFPLDMRKPLFRLLDINKQILGELHLNLQKQMINSIVNQSSVHLQQVMSIPRLYRRTNRNIPKEPSQYIIEAVSPLIKLHTTYNMITKGEIVTIMDLVIASLCGQYVGLVQELLHSMCKTEESLRRLKNRNINLSDGQTSGDTVTDEAKIREQIKLDIGYFVKETKPFASNTSQIIIKRLIDESGYGN